MSGPHQVGHYITPAFKAEPDAAELAALCDGLTPDHANRLVLLWRQMAQLSADIAAHCEPDDETADDTAPRATVVPIFERRERAAHPSTGGEFDYRRARGAAVGPEPAEDIIRRLRDGDDCSPRGLPRPELGLTAEGADLARLEMRHDVAMGRYFEDGA